MSRLAVPVAVAPQASPADKWISPAAAATVAALAGLAGALSYSHMRQLARRPAGPDEPHHRRLDCPGRPGRT
jgi:hypothetical protein